MTSPNPPSIFSSQLLPTINLPCKFLFSILTFGCILQVVEVIDFRGRVGVIEEGEPKNGFEAEYGGTGEEEGGVVVVAVTGTFFGASESRSRNFLKKI